MTKEIDELNNYRIVEFRYDAINSEIEMVLTRDPERCTADRVLKLCGIRRMSVDRYHDPEDIVLGDFESFEITRDEDVWSYHLDTGDAIITFESRDRIEI